ncbi:G-protein coupled receptor Mth2 [Orchesella cincta]|uniref:G-protein coupled receptor Mth2 n=1 Tax=Orchesella cincta TaxID=48709 RepID=A0A1D2NC24_ORCCI|nr:G-protein coupled receptor Mth2 [Orchesella cincta]
MSNISELVELDGAVINLVVPITNVYWKLFVSLISISAASLLLTIVLYILVWEKHNCQGWTQFSYLTSLFLFYCVFIPALCPGLTSGADRNATCFTLAVSNQYFFICAKTWLIIISFDLYCTIRQMRVIASNASKGLIRFACYSFIGWIFPLVLVSVGVGLNLHNQESIVVINNSSDGGLWSQYPDYGFQHCRIPNWWVWECFVFANCIFHFAMFGLISITIFTQRRKIITAEVVSTIGRQSPVLMLLRLFIVVGLSWSYIAIQDLLRAGNINTQQTWAWHIFRCIYFLQGFFISIITVTNGKTMRNITMKYPKLQGIRKLSMKMNVGKHCMDHCCFRTRKESLQSCVSQKTVESVY